MMLAARVEVVCPRCKTVITCSVGWVQENGMLLCQRCGEISQIDKDAVSLQLAKIETGRR